MNVAIIHYNAGNICSVVNALERIGITPQLTDDATTLQQADCVLFPGQGEASNTMRYLRSKGLDSVIKGLRQPVLGICIGQQLMCANSEEGTTDCLGIFPNVTVKRFVPTTHSMKVPHMGWNTLTDLHGPLLQGITEDSYVYFVHSYYVPISAFTIATTQYGHPFSAAMQRDNYYATQFHPEKSGDIGEHILRNFIALAR